ncbi:MAG: S8 family serine peptidase [Armatimonadetes bacterium]|nr:S8 family serine peptidase [Armatimonadota bacterium]MDW8153979.1 S8 family serine peptidase [Armatimonadota bacterium]
MEAAGTFVEGMAGLTADLHGTEVAGIIGARRNGVGIVGVAPEARLVALQACVPKRQGGREGVCLGHRVVRAVDTVLKLGVRILNVSFGGPSNRAVNRVVLRAVAQGVVVVAAAGNNGPQGPWLYPAALPGVLAVGASEPGGEPWSRSNLGGHVRLLAPGVDVLTTLPSDRYGFVTGISYAAAVASGAVAPVMEAVPDLSPEQLTAALRPAAAGGRTGVPAQLDICRALARIGIPEVCLSGHG